MAFRSTWFSGASIPGTGGQSPFASPIPRGSPSAATAFQVARFYYLLEARRLVSPALTAQMKDALSRPAIRHKFVKGLEDRPAAELFRKSGTWRDFHADSALIQSAGHTFIMVGLAHHPQGGEWLARIAAPLHDLIVRPAAFRPRDRPVRGGMRLRG
jgi:beta-lactamase class A